MAVSFRHCHKCGGELGPNGCAGPCFHLTSFVRLNCSEFSVKAHSNDVRASARGNPSFPKPGPIDPRPKVWGGPRKQRAK